MGSQLRIYTYSISIKHVKGKTIQKIYFPRLIKGPPFLVEKNASPLSEKLSQSSRIYVSIVMFPFYRADSIYCTIFSAMVVTAHSNLSTSLSSKVMRNPGTEVKKDVRGTTQMPVAPRR